MHRFQQLDVWRKSIDLTDKVYDATEGFPLRERFGLQAQMRRAAVSIPSNIAEGAGTSGQRAFARYLRIAYGSACELETQLIVADRRGLIRTGDAEALALEIDEIRRMLHSLMHLPA